MNSRQEEGTAPVYRSAATSKKARVHFATIRRRAMLLSGSLAMVILASACLPAAADELTGSPDSAFSLIADEVPGFGGAWVEGGGTGALHLWLVEPGDEAIRQARSRLVELLGEAFDRADVEVHAAAYTWDQLQSWFDRSVDLLSLPGVSLLDIDETRNRLVISVEDSVEQSAAVLQHLRSLEVPAEAAVIEEGSWARHEPLVVPVPIGLEGRTDTPGGAGQPGTGIPTPWIALVVLVCVGAALSARRRMASGQSPGFRREPEVRVAREQVSPTLSAS